MLTSACECEFKCVVSCHRLLSHIDTNHTMHAEGSANSAAMPEVAKHGGLSHFIHFLYRSFGHLQLLRKIPGSGPLRACEEYSVDS